MSVLILNRFTNEMAPYKEWLKDYDQDMYLFTNKRFEHQFEGYSKKNSYRKFQNNDLVDYDAVELYAQKPYDSIIALDETEMERAARLRERFNITGQKLKSAQAFRDKVLMKDYVSKAGIKTPSYKRIETAIDLYDFEKSHEYPFIIKPVDGMASKNVSVIKNQEELKEYIKNGIPKNMEVETFVNGTMYHVDGIISDNRAPFISVGKYINGTLQFKEGISVAYTLLPSNDKLVERIKKFTQKVVKSLPSPGFSPFHCEIFHTSEDELIFCEIGSRTGGGRLDIAIKDSYGVDLNGLQARNECRLPIKIQEDIQQKHLVGGVFISSKQAKLISRPSTLPFEWVVAYEPHGQEGDRFSDPSSVIDSIAIVLVKGETNKQIEERILKVREWFEEQVIWEGECLVGET